MLKPWQARTRTHCSQACRYESQRKQPVVKPKKVRDYGERKCVICSTAYRARTMAQTCCSQRCAVRKAQLRGIRTDIVPVPCETCHKVFRPRPGSAGRFCSRPCTYKGQKGEKSSQWNGGRHQNDDGYTFILIDGQYVPEHRHLVAQMLGRPLTSKETVHHINGDRSDNRIENLQLRSGSHGKGVKHQCLDCGSSNIASVEL